MGARAVLTEKQQLAAGKRLQKQAINVRGLLAEACFRAAHARTEARAAAAAESAEGAALAAALVAIDSDEHTAVNALANEVYIGFYEIADDEIAPAPAPTPTPAPDQVRACCVRA